MLRRSPSFFHKQKSCFSQTLIKFSWKTTNHGSSAANKAAAPTTTTTTKTPKSSPFSSKGNKSTNNNNKTSTAEAQTETNNNSNTSQSKWDRFNEWRKQTSVKKLVLQHGPFFGTWYFILNTSIQLAMASVLHFNLAGHIIESRELAAYVGMQDRFDEYANKTYYLLKSPIAVNGRFIANYVVIATLMAPVIPVKISWTLASYPFVIKLIPSRWRPLWKGNK
jgi:hypothetical protein